MCARLLAATAAAFAVSACAHEPPRRPKELFEARAAVERARVSSSAGYADSDLREAEQTLREAEAEEAFEPGGAGPEQTAYMARRKADRARMLGLYHAEQEALESARSRTERLRGAIARLHEAQAARALADEEVRRIRAGQRKAQAVALEAARGVEGSVAPHAHGVALTIPAADIFVAGYPLLRPLSPARIDAIAEVLRVGPPSRIVIDVAEDTGGIGVDAYSLARRRADRLREALGERGVAIDTMSINAHQGSIATVTIAITETDIVAAPPAPATGVDEAH
jgi:hypothetical protein